jgi:hypothetical protein
MKDPERLLTRDDQLAKLVASAGKDVLDDARVEKLRLSVGAAVGGASGSGILKSLFGSTAGKVVAALMLGGAVAAAVHHYSSPAVVPQAAPPPTVSVVLPLSEPAAPLVSALPEPPPQPTASVQRPSRVAPKPAPSAQPSPREGLLLLQARQSLESDPQRTLDLVRQHEREFPQSQLMPEREKLRADAIAHGAK